MAKLVQFPIFATFGFWLNLLSADPASSTSKATFSSIHSPARAQAGTPSEWEVDDWCGTARTGAKEALEEHYRRRALLTQRAQSYTLSASGNLDMGNIAVIEDDGLILGDFGIGWELDDVLACKRFYETHPDSFDLLAIYTTADVNLYYGSAFAYERNIKNEVEGIGLGLFDFSADFGSAGRLRSQLNMNSINVYPPSPRTRFLRTDHHLSVMAQEAGHRWGAWVYFDSAQGAPVVGSPELLLCDKAHWSFYADARSQFFNTSSSLEGNLWQDNGDGTYTTATDKDYYMRLDQYLMGLRPAAQVDSLWFIRNPSPSDFSCNRASETPETVSGTKVWVKIDDIVAAAGPRVPDASTAQKDFRMAFILVVPNGVKPTAYELARFDSIRTQWASYFRTSVEDLGTMNTGLPSPGPLQIVSDTLGKGAVGGIFRDQVVALGGKLPYFSYALTGGSLPPGLSLNTVTGVVSGTPNTPGGYDFTLEVCDALGLCASRQVHIDVFATGVGTVVINEIELTSRGGSLELYNKGPDAQDISNWTVETRTPFTLATLTIPAGTIIPPGACYVLNEYAGTNTANWLYFGVNIPWGNGASGSCALIDNLGNGIDFCRWGSSIQAPPPGTNWNGPNPPTPAGSRNIGRNAFSTDADNSTDFTAQVGSLGHRNPDYTSLRQTTTGSTPAIQALITNWNNIANRGTPPALSYVDNSLMTYLYDASLIAGAIKPNGDTVVYRSFYMDYTDPLFSPSGHLDVDSTTDPRATHIHSVSTTVDSLLNVQAHFILPKSADSGQFIICQFTVANTSEDTLKNVLLGMVADYDAPTTFLDNVGGFYEPGNLIWVRANTQSVRFAALSGLGIPKIYGAHCRDNPTYVHPNNGYLTGQLYQIANTSGFSTSPNEPNNLHVILTHRKQPILPPGACAAASFAMILTRGGLSDLLLSAAKAERFFENSTPLPPSSLQAVGTCQGTVNLSFTPSINPEFGYFNIYRDTLSDFSTPLLAGTTADTFFVDTVPPSKLFFYRVSAVDSACREGGTSLPAEVRAGLKGDLNADSVFSASDVVLLLSATFNETGFPAPFCVADLNCSGSLSAADIVTLINVVFNEATVTCTP